MTDERPLTAGVMGWPIRHSKSPLIFEHWFKRYEVAGRYCHLAVRHDDFSDVFRTLPKAGFRGVNVTIPHKLSALSLADRSTERARVIGAANMIVFSEDREIIADNTDGYGFMANIHAQQPHWDPSSGAAVVLGAGGASRAVLHSLIEAGTPEIRLTNRSREKAEALAADLGENITVVDWRYRSDVLAGAVTLINTTSLGMTGQPPLEIVLDELPTTSLVTDLVYSPLETELLIAARAHGAISVDGLGMLLHQARPAFRAWFGRDPEVDQDLVETCLK